MTTSETMSPEIGKLAEALSKAQGEMKGAVADAINPFFKSSYADLASVWDAIRGPLSKYGIAVIQSTGRSEKGLSIITIVAHSSGQWIKSELVLAPEKWTSQGIGSALTYGRRYSLSAMVGVAQVDDDGEAAMGRNPVTASHTINNVTQVKQTTPKTAKTTNGAF